MKKPDNKLGASGEAPSIKTCFKCAQQKPLSEYYKHKEMADGHLGKCKACTKAEALERISQKAKSAEWQESEKQRQREKHHRLSYGKKKKNPEQAAESRKRYAAKYPEKRAARFACSHLSPKMATNHLHHWSYRPEYATDLIELTKQQHYTLHRFIKYDAHHMLYRRISDNVLLDSKEAHLAWAQKVFEIHGQGPTH